MHQTSPPTAGSRIFLRWALAVFGLVIISLSVILTLKWPFTEERTVRSLEHFAKSEVHINSFDRTYFPHPGYIARKVVFSRKADGGSKELASLERLECQGSWFSMVTLTHHLNKLRLYGLRVTIPGTVPPAMNLHPELKESTTVTELVADGAVLELPSDQPRTRGLRFVFPQLTLQDIANDKAVQLRTTVQNPIPPGDLAVAAAIGPFNLSHVNETRLSGSFDFRDGNLDEFRVIRGIVSARGQFGGILARCSVHGQAQIPNFGVTESHHTVGLTAEYSTLVDGQHGNVVIESVTAHFLNTTIQGHGAITPQPGAAGKELVLDMNSERAKVEDLLRLFVKADRPPVKGPITLKAHVQLPPGQEKFLRRVRLDGDFALRKVEFTKQETMENVSKLSYRARGKKTTKDAKLPAVQSDLQAHVHLRNASAALSSMCFTVPGANARGSGTFNLETEQIDMRGKLAIQASLSRAAGGAKSIVFIPLNPFFRKPGAGAVIPFRISGDYGHPSFGVSLTSKK